ncbi:MAG TPA: hypothetical protein VL992_21430 [Tepidisphaeraceae bacterium]|nr:hypothetical protein [Tepidisphaeraceae bacterium]
MAFNFPTLLRRAARAVGLKKRPKAGVVSGTQNGVRSFGGIATTSLAGFSSPATGTYDTYRRMNAHPTIALARSIVLSPIFRNAWDFKLRPDAPPAWRDLVQQTLLPLRQQLVRDGLRALDYGWFGGEIVWEERGGRLTIGKVKPLLPDITTILADESGNFAGLENRARGTAPITLGSADGKAFLYTYDGEADNLYGRSRLENIRHAAWGPALQVAEKLGQYLKKVAGLVIQLHYPEGTSRDAVGAERSNDYLAQQILDAVSQGKSVRLPNLFASVVGDGSDPRLLESAATLAGKSQWVLSAFEAGTSDHAAGLLNTLQYLDKLMFRGWLRPERVGLEATHGTRADAAIHTDTGLLDSELIDLDFARAVNQQLVNPLLELNFGPAARDAVTIEPNPLADDSTQTYRLVIQSLLSNPKVADRIDVDALLADLAVPIAPRKRGR